MQSSIHIPGRAELLSAGVNARENIGAHSEALCRKDERLDSGLEELIYVREVTTSPEPRRDSRC